MPRSRRSILAALASGSAVGVAGCGAPTDSATPTAASATGSQTEPDPGRPTEQPTPCGPQSIATVDGNHRFDVAFDARSGDVALTVEGAIASAPSESQPAHLALAVRNRLHEEVTVQFGHAPPLSGLSLSTDAGDASMELGPVAPSEELGIVDRNDDGEKRIVPDGPTDGCWRALDRPVVPDYFVARTLSACETFERRFRVLAHPDNDGCLPPGTYRRTDAVEDRDTETTVEVSLAITVS